MPIIHDAFTPPPADAVQLRGLIGSRFDALRVNRLRNQEDYHLLWPFQEHCPAGMEIKDVPHPEIARADWQGEFIGTWVATAAVAVANSGDPVLRDKLAGLMAAWLATQEPDGYLGTYDAADRWKSWDVWIQAHALVGLLSDYRCLGHAESLAAAVRVADNVLRDFGPDKRSVGGGLHAGMASSAILEPMLWLYRETGDERYLAFGRWLADVDWEAPGGPAILSSLLSGRGVAGTGNAKGVEMLLDFAGLLELYRATGEPRYIDALLASWADIATHHLYITGSASTGEHFRADYLLRDEGYFMVGETCVTMAWLYLNFGLGRALGEARFYDMAEQALYNHLLAAQSEDGRGWAYYTGLRDRKRYRWHTDPDCCPTKGSRALAQAPLNVLGLLDDGIAVNLYEPCRANLTLASGAHVGLEIAGRYPFDGHIRITVQPEPATRFTLRLRKPGWCQDAALRVNGTAIDASADASGYFVIDRDWQPGDRVELDLDMPPRVAVDRLAGPARVAITRGPLVYAVDAYHLPAGYNLDRVVLLIDRNQPNASITLDERADGMVFISLPVLPPETAAGADLFGAPERYQELAPQAAPLQRIELVPFFAAGNADPDCYRDGVWPNYEGPASIPEFRYLVSPHPKLAREGVPEGATFQVWLPYLYL